MADPPAVDRHAADPHAGAATTLPAALPARPKHPLGFWLTLVVVVVLLVAAIVLPLTLHGGSKSSPQPAVAARTSGKVPKAAVFAESNNTVAADPGAVVVAARALLAGALPAANLSSSDRAALIKPPAAVVSPSLTLGPSLGLDDPRLPSCLAGVTDGAALFGIDRISYGGQVALLVVTADNDSSTEASAYVIGTGCAQPGSGIRAFVTVPLTG